ncbi:MAG: hypothetical protein EOM50_09145 [Erysipelotrichia bacterium]|nr:hypothetical protein [Erysipelotrichia bacterium]
MKKRYHRKKESHKLYRFTMFCMCFIVAVLLFFINTKKEFISMQTIKNFQLSDITKLMFWENLFIKQKESSVSANANYQLLKEHYYTNGTNEVVAMSDGVILSVKKDEVVMLNDSGVNVVYQKMRQVNIKANERVLKGASLGIMEESVEIHCYLNDQEISMKKALSME